LVVLALGAPVGGWVSIGVTDEAQDVGTVQQPVHGRAREEGIAEELVQLVGVPVGCDHGRAVLVPKPDRSGLCHESKRAKADAPVLAQMRELASQYPRHGYRMIQLLLARQGTRMSPDRAYRLWRSAGLQVPRKRPRRRLASARPRPNPANGPNHVWAIDFVFDTLADGRSLKCLTVVDEWTRECLAIEVGSGIRAARVVEVLARLVSLRGAPCRRASESAAKR